MKQTTFDPALVAPIAAQLLQGENYEDAVRRAGLLLQECQRVLGASGFIHAPIAAQLLQGDNYEDAVRRTGLLLRECRHVHRKEQKAGLPALGTFIEGNNLLNDFRGIEVGPDLTRDQFLRRLTGQDNITDAMRCFKEFRRKQLRERKVNWVNAPHHSDVESQIEWELQEMKRMGERFTDSLLENWRREYLKLFPRRRPKPRKK